MMNKHFYIVLLVFVFPCLADAQIELRSEEELLAVLQSEAPLSERAKACQDLAIVGGRQAIPVLASFLSDEQLSDYARMGLESMEDPEVDEVFRAQLQELEGRMLVGAINSIGIRRDPKAVSSLQALSRNASADIASASLSALGCIASDDAIASIRQALTDGRHELRATAANACLVAAEHLAAEGRQRAAMTLYDAVRRSDVSPSIRLVATYNAIVSGAADELPLLIDHLQADDPDKIDVALRAVREMEDPKVVKAVGKKLKKFLPQTQVRLIPVLAECDLPSVLKHIQSLADSSVPEVRQASLKALGEIGDASTVSVLVKAAEGGGAEATTALGSLQRLKGKDIDSLILDAMRAAKGSLRRELITILANRQATVATPHLLREATSKDEATARTALKALSTLAGPGDIPNLVDLLSNLDNEALRPAAETALARASMRLTNPTQRPQAVLDKLTSTRQSALRVSLIRVLGRIGGERAHAAVLEASRDSDFAVKDSAIRTLASWSNWESIPELQELLNFAKNADHEIHRLLAVRGYVRLLGMADYDNPRELTQKYAEVLSIAEDSDSKKLVLAALANVPHSDALKLVMEQFEDPSVQAEAAVAAVKIAGQLRQVVRETMEKIIATSENEKIAAEARKVLESGNENPFEP